MLPALVHRMNNTTRDYSEPFPKIVEQAGRGEPRVQDYSRRHDSPRLESRVPFDQEVRVVFDDLGDFVSCCSENVSLGGMFLATEVPLAIGTCFDFEFHSNQDLTLVRGRGEVSWVRESASKGSAAGMGIRFLELDAIGFELIFRTVDRHIQGGGQPFELESFDAWLDEQPGEFLNGHWRSHRGRSWSKVFSQVWASMVAGCRLPNRAGRHPSSSATH
ncbi:MAG: PilZ domain-containing protein [Thermoanaerobaculia bacterium]|nr:PilZ domain-containing protein [Thermoanaerobaculia bacterium]